MNRKSKAWNYYRQSDPDFNPQFRRRWVEPEAAKRKRPDAPRNRRIPQKP
jgi:hypothetical protein